MTSYYVYYKVDSTRAARLRGEIEPLLDRIHAASGIRGRWMRRRDEASTYMEVYEGVQDDAAFDALLKREAAALGLDRHVERFVCA
jgi:hypothetical protein